MFAVGRAFSDDLRAVFFCIFCIFRLMKFLDSPPTNFQIYQNFTVSYFQIANFSIISFCKFSNCKALKSPPPLLITVSETPSSLPSLARSAPLAASPVTYGAAFAPCALSLVCPAWQSSLTTYLEGGRLKPTTASPATIPLGGGGSVEIKLGPAPPGRAGPRNFGADLRVSSNREGGKWSNLVFLRGFEALPQDCC